MEKSDADLSSPSISSISGGYSSSIDLPFEVLSFIFSFVDHPTRQSARLVCKSWYNAAWDPPLIQNEYYVLGREIRDENEVEDDEFIQEKFEELQNLVSNKQSYNIKINGHKYYHWATHHFWKTIGERLKALYLKDCEVFQDELLCELMYCPKVKYLTLDCCCKTQRPHYGEFTNHLGLETLEVICTRVADIKFTTILNHAPNLKSFQIQVTLIPRVHSSKVALEYLLGYCQHNPHVTVDLYLKVIGRRRGDVERKILENILLPNVRLRLLHTNFLPKAICEHYLPTLSDLIVFLASGEEVKLRDSFLQSIQSNFPNLCHFALRDGKLSRGTNLRLPPTLTRLYLDFNSQKAVTQHQLLTGLCSDRNTTLTKATFVLPRNITNLFFISFAHTYPSVTFLRLVNCNFCDQSLQAIMEHLVLLQHLFISGNRSITDAGFTGKIKDGQPLAGNMNRYHISRLKDLQKLGLHGCPRIRGSLFTEIALPRLKIVSLDSSKVPLAELKHLVENNPSIEELRIQRRLITDEFINYASEKFSNLHLRNVAEWTKTAKRGGPRPSW